MIPADCKHFPQVAADSGAGAGPGRPSSPSAEPSALRLWHPGKLLHPCSLFLVTLLVVSVAVFPHLLLLDLLFPKQILVCFGEFFGSKKEPHSSPSSTPSSSSSSLSIYLSEVFSSPACSASSRSSSAGTSCCFCRCCRRVTRH